MPKAKLPFKEFSWTPELAYAIGLIATDGNLSGDGRHITMRSTDHQLLETFCQCLGLQNSICQSKENHKDGYKRKPAYRVQFSNVQFYNWLISIGITPAKSHTIGEIKLPEEYFRDFLRGHLDGDGSILTYQDRYNFYKGKRYLNTRLYTYFISASKKHIHWLYEMIKKTTPIQGAVIFQRPIRGRVAMWKIKIAKYESLKLFQWLYYRPELPALERKRELAEYFLQKIRNGKLIRV